MDDPIRLSLLNATTQLQTQTAEQLIDSAWQTLRPKFVEGVRGFLAQPMSPRCFSSSNSHG